MAARRMFGIDFMESDSFLDMSNDAKFLYVYLCLGADDDGFIQSPKGTARKIGVNPSILKELEENGYIMQFKSGVVLIRHWLINNTIRSDRYTPTVCTAERASVELYEKVYYPAGTYKTTNSDLESEETGNFDEEIYEDFDGFDSVSTRYTNVIPAVNQRYPQYSIDKISVVQGRLEQSSTVQSSVDKNSAEEKRTENDKDDTLGKIEVKGGMGEKGESEPKIQEAKKQPLYVEPDEGESEEEFQERRKQEMIQRIMSGMSEHQLEQHETTMLNKTKILELPSIRCVV